MGRKAVHGMSRTPLYKMWSSIMSRARHGKGYAYEFEVCERWKDFTSFYADVNEEYQRCKDAQYVRDSDGMVTMEVKNTRTRLVRLDKKKPIGPGNYEFRNKALDEGDYLASKYHVSKTTLYRLLKAEHFLSIYEERDKKEIEELVEKYKVEKRERHRIITDERALFIIWKNMTYRANKNNIPIDESWCDYWGFRNDVYDIYKSVEPPVMMRRKDPTLGFTLSNIKFVQLSRYYI